MATDSEIRAWARARGVQVSNRGKVPDQVRADYERARPGPGPRLLPSPDEIAEDAGIIDIDDSLSPASVVGDPPPGPEDSPGPELGGSGPGPDEPPPHARREWRQHGKTSRTKPKPPRITVSVQHDITAKVGLMLEIPGQVWAARDPVCGGTFLQQRPAIAGALTDIICESADLVAFFTGPAGGFMRWFTLATAVYPVAGMMMAHHVYHSIEASPATVDEQQYAAL